MSRLQVVISEATDRKLRHRLSPQRKGDISRVIEEAILEWLKNHKGDKK